MTTAAEALRTLTGPVRAMIRAGVVVQIIGSAAEIVPFIAIVELARRLFAGRTETSDLMPIAWIVVVALGVRGLCSGIAIMITHFADARLGAILRRCMIDHLGGVRLAWFGSHASGEVKKAVDDDVAALHHLVAHHAVETTAAITVPIVGLGYLLTVDWRLALVGLLPIPLYGAAFAYMMRDASEQMAAMNEGTTRVNTAIVEFVQGIAVVKAFGRSGRAHQAYRSATSDFASFFAAWVRPMLRLESLSTMALAPAFVLVLNLGFGLWLIDAGWVSGTDVLAASMVALVLPSSIVTLSHGMQARMQAVEAAGRIQAILQTPVLAESLIDPGPVPSGVGAIELRDVVYRYDDGTVGLDGVSLRVEPGQVVAIVGASGSGKSTLASLVLRYDDVAEGSVLINGHDVREWPAAELYGQIGFVLQDVQLLHATVAENIALGRPDADRATIEAVARAAQIHDRIEELPRGYDSVVDDDARFSVGEAQRVSIARAMLHDPPILVLDEATAFADPDTEAAVQDALSALAVGRTLLVVAHRLETIVDADQIVVLDRGRVVEQGRHAQLLQQGGAYAASWQATQLHRSAVAEAGR